MMPLVWSAVVTVCFTVMIVSVGSVSPARCLARRFEWLSGEVDEPGLVSRRAQISVGSSYTLELVRPGCAWREELYACNPMLCFQWSFTHHGAPVTAQGDTRRGCQSVVCGALFERFRGKDKFVYFEEAVAFDDAARDRVTAAGSACEWPTKLQRGDSCWRMASDSSQRELV